MPTSPLLVAKLAPVVLLNVVNAPVDAVVAPMAVEFRPVEVKRPRSANTPLVAVCITKMPSSVPAPADSTVPDSRTKFVTLLVKNIDTPPSPD